MTPFNPGQRHVTAISKRLRFEVLRRDNHACRYCGATAPEVKLTIDHVIPVALGGTDEPSNLVTACAPCNSGKSSSNPAADLIADVSADALRWANAIQEAGTIMLADTRARDDLRERFRAAWNTWKYGPADDRRTLPLDDDWRTSVDNFMAAGLPSGVLGECIDKAMTAKHVQPENIFRYMCGIAWRKVTELREMAEALIEADTAPPGKHARQDKD